MDLTNNTILITGGTSGIGLAFAREFHRHGNQVIICGRRQNRLAEIEKELPGIITRVCDISRDEERKALAEWAGHSFPNLNILMNNAGVQYAFNMQQEIPLQKLHDEIETNLLAPIHLCSLFSEVLTKQDKAAIINISSGLAFAPLAFMPVYCATKAAIHSFTMSLRHQMKNTSVKVFEIAPPSVDTELGHDRRADKSQSHGGLPVDEFLAEAIEALKNDKYEAPIAQAKNLRAKGEELFEAMNSR